MSFLKSFNASGILNTVKTVHNLVEQSSEVYSPTKLADSKPLKDLQFEGKLTVNGHTIPEDSVTTINDSDTFTVDLWINTVFDLLNNNLANNKVFSDNLGLPFDSISIETKVKFASPIKPLRVISDRVVQNREEGWQFCYDLADQDDRANFNLDKLKSVKGYLNGKAYPLFSNIGKCTVDVAKVFKLIPNFKTSPSLETISKIVPIKLLGLTELSGQLNVKDVTKDHQFILTCHHKGLVTLSYGDYTYNVGLIGLHKTVSYQYVDQTTCKIAHFFNDIGVSRYVNGTEILNSNGKGIKGKTNLIHDTITKHYGKGWQLLKDESDITLLTSTGKVITIAKYIDNGLTASPSLYPLYDGILSHQTVDNLLGQVSTVIGRYLKLHTSLEISNTAKTFNDKLLKTYIKCYVYQTLMLQGNKVKIDFTLPVESIRKMLPSDQYLTTSKLGDKLTQAINRYGMQSTKDAILTAKKCISFEEISLDFIPYM